MTSFVAKKAFKLQVTKPGSADVKVLSFEAGDPIPDEHAEHWYVKQNAIPESEAGSIAPASPPEVEIVRLRSEVATLKSRVEGVKPDALAEKDTIIAALRIDLAAAQSQIDTLTKAHTDAETMLALESEARVVAERKLAEMTPDVEKSKK